MNTVVPIRKLSDLRQDEDRSEAQKLSNSAAVLLAEGQRRTATVMLQRASALDPDNMAWACNLAIMLTRAGEFDTASQMFASICRRDPTYVPALVGWGQLSRAHGDMDDAIALLRKAQSLNPTSSEIEFELTMALLANGQYEEGFERYEQRLNIKPERLFPGLERWSGQTGKHVYVWAEQGVGDTVQFARFLPMLAEVSRKVTFALPASMMAMFGGYGKVCELTLLGTEPPDCPDYECALMSLAKHFQCRSDNIPEDPGLFASTVSVPWLLPRLQSSRMKVGLIWTGNLAFAKAKDRGIPFQELLPLASVPGCDFYSLQVGPRAEDLATARAQALVQDCSALVHGDWAECVRLLRELDLLICTDCGPAHVAAAMGVPVWLLLHTPVDWRWAGRPWYPSVRLFRQKVSGNWGPVVSEAKAALTALTKGVK